MVFDLEHGVSNKLAVLGCQNIIITPPCVHGEQAGILPALRTDAATSGHKHSPVGWNRSGGAHAKINITAKKISHFKYQLCEDDKSSMWDIFATRVHHIFVKQYARLLS